MAVPQPRSFQRILGEMLDSFLSKIGVNDLNRGSVVRSFFEAIAQAVARANGDAMRALRVFDIDKAVSDTLKKIARDENVDIQEARVATTLITIRDNSFTKIETKVFAGTRPPNVGSTKINVADAENFPSVGAIYIGRGTPNVEGPIGYTNPVQNGQFWELTLDTPTVKFHNISEPVILSQGGPRTVTSGTLVRAPATGASSAVNFALNNTVVILDGEDTLENIRVSAQEPGENSNVPSKAIKEFVIEPFTGAAVENPNPVTNGLNEASDEEIRIAIRRKRESIGLGTKVAVRNSVIGAEPQDENAVVASSQIVETPEKTTLFIDDGNLYEPKTLGVGVEPIIDSAVGNPDLFQLSFGGQQTSVEIATLTSSESDPFDIQPLDRLAIIVGGDVSEHIFQDGDFINNRAATAFEVVASINANASLLYRASTRGNGTRVAIQAKTEENEFLQVTTPTEGGDAAVAMGLPTQEVRTLLLYRNGTKLLNRNGRDAVINTEDQVDWSDSILTGDTLIVNVDRTGFITYTITDQDFIDEGTHIRVDKNNRLEAWAAVFNNKIAGVNTEVNGNALRLTSNRGQSNRASLEISTLSTLFGKGMFSAAKGISSEGSESDFTLSRNTGQLQLREALSEGESLSAGSERTRAEIESDPILGGQTALNDQADLWFLFDDPEALTITTGVVEDTEITTSKQPNNRIRYLSNIATAFEAVEPNDYLIVWSEELDPTNRGEFRIHTVAPNYVEVEVTDAEYAAAAEVFNQFRFGFVVVRTAKVPQKISIPPASYNINTIAQLINAQLEMGSVLVQDDEVFIVSSNTQGNGGAVALLTFNEGAKPLNFVEGNAVSQTSLFAFEESQEQYDNFPLFQHGVFASEDSKLPPANYITNIDLGTVPTFDPNKQLVMAQPFRTVKDMQAFDESVPVHLISGSAVDLLESDFIKRIRDNDRWYVANGYDFGENDFVVVVLDDNPSTKTFPIPLFRKLVTNITFPLSNFAFNAYDTDSGATALFPDFFGDDFDFTNYKAFMRAKNVLEGDQDEDALLIRSTQWGRSGEVYDIGYIYPGFPDSPIQSSVSVGDKVQIRISLKSGSAVPDDHDGTTEFDVTIQPHPTIGAAEIVTYTYNGNGAAPNLSLSGGEYVRIGEATQFDVRNTGNFRVSDLAGFVPTAASFSVIRANGSGVAETDRAVLSTNALEFFESDDTTATEVNDYIASDLADWITSEIVDKNGTSGGGVIGLSTEEVLEFADDNYRLRDGLNWIKTNDFTGGSPEFEFKRALELPSTTGYNFNEGEEVRIMPTTARQVQQFVNILAVSGFSTLGLLNTVRREQTLELSTQVVGGQGAVQFAGGEGNELVAEINAQAIRRDGLMVTSIDKSASTGFHSDQWVKLTAAIGQKKLTNYTTSNTIRTFEDIGNNQTRVLIENREPTSRLFGLPRRFVRTNGIEFQVEKQGKFVCITYTGTMGDLAWQRSVEINHDNTVNVVVTKDLLSNQVTIRGRSGAFSLADKGDTLTIAGFANAANNGTFEIDGISDDNTEIYITNENGVTETLNNITIDIQTAVGEGDTVLIGEPFNILNRGKFRVVRAYKDSIYVENDRAVPEILTVTDLDRTITINNDTEFSLTGLNGFGRLLWDGDGTEPFFDEVKRGDILELRTGEVVAANVGTYMVSGFIPKTQESSRVTMARGFDMTAGQSWRAFSELNLRQYEIWYRIDATGSAPGTPGFTQVQVDILSADTPDVVATKTKAALEVVNGGNDFTVDIDPDDDKNIIVTVQQFVPAGAVTNVDVGGDFEVERLAIGQRTSLSFWAPEVTFETDVTFAALDIIKIPALQMFEYEATNAGDDFEITGDLLGEDAIGSYNIAEVVSREEIIIDGLLGDTDGAVGVSTQNDEIFVVEEFPYTGYKMIRHMAVSPGAINNMNLVFDTTRNFEKINDTGDITVSAESKLGFNTTIRFGLDSYRYHTGLIAEANRIVYGEPRDEVSNPGVAAAGAEIFINAPDPRRVKITISIRITTGAPFSRLQESVRNTVFSVINSNPIGNSIAFSDIITAVNGISGVRAIAIAEPDYDENNDLIIIQPGEKAQVLDIVNDIIVLKVG